MSLCHCFCLLTLLSVVVSDPSDNSSTTACKKLSFGNFSGDPKLYAENDSSKKWLKAFVVPEHKLIFCKIAKNGSSGWLRLLRRMAGFEDWERSPYFMHDGKVGGLSQLLHFGPDKAAEMILDPSWTKVAIFREPLERLLSAFLDKVHGLRDSSFQLKTYSHELFDVPVEELKDMSFRDFVHRLHVAVNGGVLDQHWSLQSLECGMEFWGPLYDLILYIEETGCDKEQMREEVFNAIRPNTPNPAALEDAADAFKKVEGAITSHGTDHGGEWYTSEILEEAYRIYQMDYTFFNVPKPTLQRLNLQEEQGTE